MVNSLLSFGKRIAYLRRKKGWSQELLGFNAMISKNYIADLEKGRRNPTLKILVKLALAFDIDLETLLKGVDVI